MKKGHRDLFLLVGVVAVGLVALRLLRPDRGEDPRHDVPDDVATCRENQRALHRALVDHVGRAGGLPAPGALGEDVHLLSALFVSGALEDTPEHRALLACPGPGAVASPSGSDPTALSAADVGYAVRDLSAHPLERFPTGGESPFLACDQAGGPNHDGALNVLYADGSVRTLLLNDLKERGVVPAEVTALELGPEAALESLRVFPAEGR